MLLIVFREISALPCPPKYRLAEIKAPLQNSQKTEFISFFCLFLPISLTQQSYHFGAASGNTDELRRRRAYASGALFALALAIRESNVD